MAATALAHEKVWVRKAQYEKAECLYYERLAKVVAEKVSEDRDLEASAFRKRSVSFRDSDSPPQEAQLSQNEQSANSSKKSKDKNNKAAKRHRNLKKSKSDAVDAKEIAANQQESQGSISPIVPAGGSLVNEIAKARQHLKKSLQCVNGIASCTEVTIQDLVVRVANMEKESHELRASVEDLRQLVKKLDIQLQMCCHPIAICPPKLPFPTPVCPVKSKEPAKSADDDDDVDLFGSDSEGENAEAAKIREERLAAYAAKKTKEPVLIAKSNIILDVKPWDDETDMKAMEAEVRKIECDGLLWGAAKLVPLAYGIHKLQISCVVEDDKVSVDWLTETIQDIEDYVQSVDIAAFNKV